MTDHNPPAALEGIRVMDFSHVYQGPVATQILADFGADVIKIERPGGGDWSRAWGPYVHGVSLPFAGLNRNKRSLTLNLKSEEGQAIALDLVRVSDVLVHNFRPGVMERLGLGYEALREINPRLVYARSSGWGDEGPYVERGRGGHNLLALAAAGWFEPNGPDGLPVPAGMSADYPAGLLLGQAILIALLARERTGQGQIVSTDLLSAAFHAHTWTGTDIMNADRITDPGGIGTTESAIRKSFRTADGYIELSPVFAADALRDISVAMGLGDLSKDPRFASQEDRVANSDALNEILAQRFKQKTTQAWIETLEPQGVLCGEIKSFAEAVDDPQIAANDMVVEMDHPEAGSLRVFGTPIRMTGTPAAHDEAAPLLGEDNDAILGELGYSDGQIAVLREKGVVG